MPETYRGSVRIDAPPSLVFAHFTRADLLAAWMGDGADVDPRPDGRFVLYINGGPIAGRYVEVVPDERVVITWGRQGSHDFPPGASTLDVRLRADGDGTIVDIEHSGLPGTEAGQHELGWKHYLSRLAVAATGSDPGPDPWASALPPAAVPHSDR